MMLVSMNQIPPIQSSVFDWHQDPEPSKPKDASDPPRAKGAEAGLDEKPAVAKSGLSIGIGRVISGNTNQKVPKKSSKRQASKVANKDDDEKDGKGNPKLTEPKSKVAKTADSDTTCPGVVETAPVPEKPKRPSALRAPKKAVPEAPLAEANHGAEAPDSVKPKAAKRQRKAKTPGKDGNEEKGKEPQDEKENNPQPLEVTVCS